MKIKKFETTQKIYEGEVLLKTLVGVSYELTPDEGKALSVIGTQDLILTPSGTGAVIEVPEEDLGKYEEVCINDSK